MLGFPLIRTGTGKRRRFSDSDTDCSSDSEGSNYGLQHDDRKESNSFKPSCPAKRQKDLLDGMEIPGAGLKHNQHGPDFQLNLLSLVLWRAYNRGYPEFRLATELPEAEKFDDVVFQYQRNRDEPWRFRLFQAKHGEGERLSIIDRTSLVGEDDKKDFSLHKYFRSFMKIKRRCQENSLYSTFSGAEVEDISLVTNIDFSSDGVKSCFEIDHENDISQDELLGFEGLRGTCKYKIFNARQSTLARELIPIFNGTSDFYRLVQVLAFHIVNKARIDKTVEHIKECTQPLKTAVFLSEKSEVSDVFFLRFRSAFLNCEGLSEDLVVFRLALLKEVSFLRTAYTFPGITLSGPTPLSIDPTHLKELASQLAHAINFRIELRSSDFSGEQKRLVLALFNFATGKIRGSAKDPASNAIRTQLKLDLCRIRGVNKVTNKDLESIQVQFSRDFGDVGVPSDLIKLNEIADALACKLKNGGSSSSSSESPLEAYRNEMGKEVLNFSTGLFLKSFVDGEARQGASGTLSANAKEFRRILQNKIITDDDLKDTVNYLMEVSLPVSKGLFDDFQRSSDLRLNDPKTFARQMHGIISSKASSDKVVKINAGSLVLSADQLKVFKANVCVLGEDHILVEKFSKTRFSTHFMELGNFAAESNAFREELMALFGSDSFKSISEKILHVEIEGFQCDREELVMHVLPQPYTENDFADFFEKLRIIVKYPNRFELTDFLEAEMRNEFRNLNTKAFSGLNHGILHRWMTERVGTFYTVERARNLFEEIDRDIMCWPMDGVSRSYFATVPMKYAFKTYEDKLTEFLKDERCVVMSANFQDVLLGRIRTAQSFLRLQSDDSEELQKYTRQFGYMFFKLELLRSSSFREDLARNLKDRRKWSLLVIECDHNVNARKLFEKLRALLLWEPSRKVVLITASGDPLSRLFEEDPYFGEKFFRESLNTSFFDLAENSQSVLLKNAKLCLQGRIFGLCELLDGSLVGLIDAAILAKMITEEVLQVGNEVCASEGYDVSYYIERSVFTQVVIRSAATEECSDEFVISDSEEEFKDCCRRSGSANVHWLRRISNQLFWQRTRGKIAAIVEYRDVEVEYSLLEQQTAEESEIQLAAAKTSESDLLRVDEARKFEIISNIAGMGKSTVLSNMEVRLKTLYPSLWVVRIDLSDHTCFLNNEAVNRKANVGTLQGKDQASLIRFLVNLIQSTPKTRLKTEFEVSLLANVLAFRSNLKVALLFDAFDEISPTYKDIVLDLLTGLRATHAQCVLVTTRPQFQQVLERYLGVFACTLRKFSVREQEIFLTKFWRRNVLLKKSYGEVGPSFEGARLDVYVRALIEKQFDAITVELTGIPLQLRLLAEIFETSGAECGWQGCEEFLGSENLEPRFPERLNAFDMYSKFVERKHWIFRNNKMRQDVTNVAVEKEILDSFKTFRKQHQKLAIYTIFDSSELTVPLSALGDYFEELEEVNILITRIRSGEERRGIVNQVKHGKPHFIHRTFAEYFLVDFLRDVLLRRTQQAKMYDLFMMKVLSNRSSHETTLNFFDKWLEREKDLIPKQSKAEFGESIRKTWNKTSKWYRELLTMCAEKSHDEIVTFLGECVQEYVAQLRGQISSRTRSADLLRIFDSVDFVDTILHRAATKCEQDMWEGKRILQNIALMRRVKLSTWIRQLSENDSLLARENKDRLPQLILDCAIDSGDLEVCQRSLQNGMDLNAVGHLGLTPLQTAALEGQLHIIKWMMSSGVEPSARDCLGRDVMHLACLTGNLKVCQWLVLSSVDGGGGLDINVKTAGGRSLLHSAVTSKNTEMLQWLLDQGTRIDCTDDVGWTPLHIAVSTGQLTIVQWLLEKGENIHATTLQGRTVLHEAARAFKPDTFECLINRGLDHHVLDHNDYLPIQLAACRGHLKLVQRMLLGRDASYGTHPNGDTLLHFAALSGMTHICEWLLDCEQLAKAGIHINARGHNGRTMLHLAMRKTTAFPQWLINKGADAQCSDDNGYTLLHYAAAFGKYVTCRWILQDKQNGGLGADPTVKSNDNSGILHSAAVSKNYQFCIWLVNTIGLDAFEANDRGQTAMSLAEDTGFHLLASFLKGLRNRGCELDQASFSFLDATHVKPEKSTLTARKTPSEAADPPDSRLGRKCHDYFRSCLELVSRNKAHYMIPPTVVFKFYKE